jgi:hypothetical protein
MYLGDTYFQLWTNLVSKKIRSRKSKTDRSSTVRKICAKYILSTSVRIRIQIGSGFNQVSGSVSGTKPGIRIREDKNDPQKKLGNFMFGSAGCSLLRAEDFFCGLLAWTSFGEA